MTSQGLVEAGYTGCTMKQVDASLYSTAVSCLLKVIPYNLCMCSLESGHNFLLKGDTLLIHLCSMDSGHSCLLKVILYLSICVSVDCGHSC